MLEDNTHYYGPYRVTIRRRPNKDEYDMVVVHHDPVTNRQSKVLFDGPDMVFAGIEEAFTINFEEDSLLTFSGQVEGAVRDMFFAIASALGMDTDARRARDEGIREGENSVLWEYMRRTLGPAPTAPITIKSPTSYTYGGSGGSTGSPQQLTFNGMDHNHSITSVSS